MNMRPLRGGEVKKHLSPVCQQDELHCEEIMSNAGLLVFPSSSALTSLALYDYYSEPSRDDQLYCVGAKGRRGSYTLLSSTYLSTG